MAPRFQGFPLQTGRFVADETQNLSARLRHGVPAREGAQPISALRRWWTMSILWIILIVVLVLALLGFFGRGRAF
ncbi:MAG TPA: hypothetical protein VF091_01585 [Gaiellaceae bacterium]